MTSSQVEIAHRGDGLWATAWKNVIILSYTSTPTVRHLEDSVRVSDGVKSAYPQGWGVVSIADRRVGLPDGETRKRAAAQMEEAQAHVWALANVLEGEGFWSAASRSALVGMMLLSRAKYPQQIFTNVTEAAPWLSQLARPTGSLDAGSLAQVLVHVRSEHLKTAT